VHFGIVALRLGIDALARRKALATALAFFPTVRA
jgi:hypothetical protein